jgi:DNA polymerase III subunit delta
MVSIRNSEADRFVGKPDPKYSVCLVFGSDLGLVSERARKLAHASVDDVKDPFQLVRLDTSTVASDPVRLIDEVNTMPLFGGRRAVWVEAGSKAFVTVVEAILSAPPMGCSLIIEAGNLKRDSALRKLVERSPRAASVECFPDDAALISKLIDSSAAAAGIAVTAEAKQALIASLGADRLSTRSELEKLFLYVHGTTTIRLADVDAIITNAAALSMEAAVDGAFCGDLDAIDATLMRVYAEGSDPSQLLGAALRHGVLLHRACLAMQDGQSIQDSIDAVAPRFFFKRRQGLERQLRLWSAARLFKAVVLLAEASGRSRREYRLAAVIASRALWSVARMARQRRSA